MRRFGFAFSLFVSLFVTIPAFAVEPLIVDLWPGKTPGDVGIKGEETSRIHQSPLVGPTKEQAGTNVPISNSIPG